MAKMVDLWCCRCCRIRYRGGAVAISASTLAWTVTKAEKEISTNSDFKDCAEVALDKGSIGYAHNELSQKIVREH